MSEIEKHLESLQKALKEIRLADHMLYITYPMIKDKRLLIQALDHIYQAFICMINAVLQYDFINKRIKLSDDSKENFDLFLERCARRYNLNEEEIQNILELFKLIESHKKSPLEFSRREKVVIMSDSLKTAVIDAEKLKKYLNFSKSMLNKVKFGMNISI
jgi:hypothetical protein